jgi:MFS family permease
VSHELAVACLVAAAVVFALGECLHATSFMPLVADLAPLALRGRYMATAGLSWWVGLALAPTLGGQLLAVSPALALIGAAAVAATTIGFLRASEAALPAARNALAARKHEERDRGEVARGRGDRHQVKDLVVAEDGRHGIGPLQDVDDRPERVQEPAGHDERRSG